MVPTEARILCVDDESAILEIISHFLQEVPGFRVDTATSAKEALKMIHGQEYDAIVADYLMPEMNGIELLNEIRGMKLEIPFIVLTGKGNEDVAVDALNLGADFYIQKGGDPKHQCAELANMIKQSVKHRRSTESLLKMTETLQAIIKSSPMPIYALDPHGIVLTWNRAAERVFGWKAEEVMGKPLPIVPQDASDEFRILRERVLGGDSFAGLEVRRLRKDGRLIDVLLWAAPLRDERGRISGIMASAQEITEHKAMETKLRTLNRLYAFLSNANAAIVRMKTRQALFDEICRVAVEKGEFKAAWVGILDEETKAVVQVASCGPTEWTSAPFTVSADETPEGQGPTGKAIREGRLFMSKDIANDPDMAPWRDHAARSGVRSAAAIPIRFKGKTIGALTIHTSEADFFRQDERELIEEIASDLSFAIDSIAREEARKRVQSALRREATFTSTTLDTAGVVIAVLDREGRIVRFNKEGEMVTKFMADEVVGTLLWDKLIPKEDIEKVRGVFSEIVGGRYPIECECDWLTRDGTKRKIDWTNTALPERDGSVKFVIATGVDVTEKRLAEESLRASEEQLRLVTDNMIDMLTRIDAEGRYVYVSPSHKTQMGWEPDDLLGKNFIEFIHPDDAEKVLETVSGHLEKKDLFGTLQFRLKRADGEYVWVESTGSALLDKDGGVIGGVFGTRDISKRMEAVEKLRKRTQEAEAAKMKAQIFLDFMSHDISNIVTPMLAYADLIGESEKVPPEFRKYSSRISEQVRRVGRFTADVRRLSHAEIEAYSGFQPVDLKSVFEDAKRAVAARYLNRALDVEHSFPEGPVRVPGKGHIEDVIEHLLENALKYVKEEHVRIEVSAKEVDGAWRVDICDNGPGISDGQKKLLLSDALDTPTRFERGIASGLSFSGLIVKQLGGELLIEDRVPGDSEKGTRIVLRLPIADETRPAA